MQTQKKKNEKEIAVKIVLDAWQREGERFDKFLGEIADDDLKKEIAAGKNTGVYLVGHLVAVGDNLFEILGLGERPFPQLEEIFLRNPDNKNTETVSIEDLKNFWKEISQKLTAEFAKLSPEQWFEKHTSVSAEDFAKEPHRNRLNVLLSRTLHQSNHFGQLALLKK
jgi:DinB superfamily